MHSLVSAPYNIRNGKGVYLFIGWNILFWQKMCASNIRKN